MITIVSLTLLCAGIFFVSMWGSTRAVRVATGIGATVSLLWLTTYHVIDAITGRGIDESVFYHLKANWQGVALMDFSTLIAAAIVGVTLIAFLGYVVMMLPYSAKNKDFSAYRYCRLGLLLIVGSIFISPATGEVFGFGYVFKSKFYPGSVDRPTPDAYHEPKIRFDDDKKNFVYLYIESLERTYFDEERFPGLMPNLSALMSEAMVFTDIKHAPATGWTIAGMVASQCGVPLFSPSHGNSLGALDRFLPKANCIGDILSDLGYTLHYMGGANNEFAGKGKFYRHHGYSQVDGFEELKSELEDSDYVTSWGLYDDTLYKIALKRIKSLAESEKHFGLVLLTLDTHHPKGNIADQCGELQYGNGENDMLNAVHCADKLAAEFIDDLRSIDDLENTVIIVQSDHIAMRNTAYSRLKNADRRNLFMIFDPSLPEGVVNNRPGTLLDIGPTILDILGASVDGLGFGRNLLLSSTLRETEKNFDEFLTNQASYVASLWNYPQITEGIELDVEDKIIRFGDRSAKYPVVVKLDADMRVDSLVLANTGRKGLPGRVRAFSAEQRFIWLDKCLVLNQLRDASKGESSGVCYALGQLGGDEISVQRMLDGERVDHQELIDYFEKRDVREARAEPRRQSLIDLAVFGARADVEHLKMKSERLRGKMHIRSGGYHAGPSWVRAAARRVGGLKRGISVVELTGDGSPKKLVHIDTCDLTSSAQDAEAAYTDVAIDSIGDVIGNDDAIYALVAHDSAVCGDNQAVRKAFSGVPVNEHEKLGYRQPYIAIVQNGRVVYERVGPEEGAIGVTLELANIGRVDARLPTVAHAGGQFNGKNYTNSLDALHANKNNYSVFEIDLSWTKDGRLVCIHDWHRSFVRSFGKEPTEIPTLAQFTSLVRDNSMVKKCTDESLVTWMRRNPDKRIVTDIKGRNIQGLSYLAAEYPDVQRQFLPQVYSPEEYFRAKELGYDDLIWTLYRYDKDNGDVLEMASTMRLFGITMPRERAESGLPIHLKALGIGTWVHTINDLKDAERMLQIGASNVYTDVLLPSVIENVAKQKPD